MERVYRSASREKLTSFLPLQEKEISGLFRDGFISRAFYGLAVAAADLASLAAACFLAAGLRLFVLPALFPVFPTSLPPAFAQKLWWAVPVALVCLSYEGLYARRFPFWREAKRLARACALTFLFILSAAALGKLGDELSRTVLVLACALWVFLLPAARFLVRWALHRLGLGLVPVLILGAGKTGELVAKALLREWYLGCRVVGFLDDDPAKKARGVTVNSRLFPVRGGFNDCQRVMDLYGVRHVVVAAPGMGPGALVDLVSRLQRRAASVTVVPDLFGVPVMGVEVDYFFDERVLSLRVKNNLASPANMLLKRAFDLAAGVVIFVAVLPLMILIALAVKLDSPGPVIYAHRRIGQGGREFMCYKFRTMQVNADEHLQMLLQKDPALRAEWERDFKLKNDPRVTSVGMFLRRTSLDELPQIFNVLKGEMSLVGPRPIVKKEVLRFGPHIHDFYLVRPGITGLWQVNGRNDIDYPERVRLESWYVRNWSLWLDITLLIRTVGVVLARRGAY